MRALYEHRGVKAGKYEGSKENKSTALGDMRSWVAIKQIPGGDVRQSFLVLGGGAFSQPFPYAGFETMTKKFTNPKILLLNEELELKAEKENADVRISDPSEYQSIVNAEWQVIFDIQVLLNPV